MFVMYDSVNIDLIPNGPHAVLGYINGNWPTAPELRKRFPHARVAELSVGGMIAAPGYDIERGDYAPDQAGELFQLARDAGIWRPLFYAQLSNMPTVKDSLRPHLKDRAEVRLMVAAWDGVALVPAGYDAKQFTDRALGRNLDESVCLDDFFPPLGPPKPSDRALRATVEVDPDSNTWTVHPEAAAEVAS